MLICAEQAEDSGQAAAAQEDAVTESLAEILQA